MIIGEVFNPGVIWAGVIATVWNLIALSIDCVWPTNRVPFYVAVASALLLVLTVGVVVLGFGGWPIVTTIPFVAFTAYTVRLCRRRSRQFVPHPISIVDSWRILGGLAVAFVIVLTPLAMIVLVLIWLLTATSEF